MTKLNKKKNLNFASIQNNERLALLKENREQLEDKFEFFDFMRGENKLKEKRERLQEYNDLIKKEVETGKGIYSRQTKLENMLEIQSKNVTFMNSMIKKSGLNKEEHFIFSPFNAFKANSFKERLKSMKKECENYFDAIDLTLTLKGKKKVKALVEELNINYEDWERAKYERGTRGKEVLFSRMKSREEGGRAQSGIV